MRVRFIKPLRVYRRGDVVDLGDGEANVLIAREIVEPVVLSRPCLRLRPSSTRRVPPL
jgi:hypothetical protein